MDMFNLLLFGLVIYCFPSSHCTFEGDEHNPFLTRLSAVSKSCYSHIGQLRCIRSYLDHKTASTIATSTA